MPKKGQLRHDHFRRVRPRCNAAERVRSHDDHLEEAPQALVTLLLSERTLLLIELCRNTPADQVMCRAAPPLATENDLLRSFDVENGEEARSSGVRRVPLAPQLVIAFSCQVASNRLL